MSDNVDNMESVQKKLEQLDTELNEFLQVVSDVKEMRNAAVDLHGRLKDHEGEIENQKMELEQLMASMSSMMMSFDEKAGGVFSDLERKTDELLGELKSGISTTDKIGEESAGSEQKRQLDNLEAISKKCHDLQAYCDSLKSLTEGHAEKMQELERGHAASSSVYETVGTSLSEIRKKVYELQKKPYEIDNKIKKLEERLEISFNEKLSRQRTFLVILMVALVIGVVLTCSFLYLS